MKSSFALTGNDHVFHERSFNEYVHMHVTHLPQSQAIFWPLTRTIWFVQEPVDHDLKFVFGRVVEGVSAPRGRGLYAP